MTVNDSFDTGNVVREANELYLIGDRDGLNMLVKHCYDWAALAITYDEPQAANEMRRVARNIQDLSFKLLANELERRERGQ